MFVFVFDQIRGGHRLRRMLEAPPGERTTSQIDGVSPQPAASAPPMLV